MNLNFNFYNILIFTGVVQGVIFSFYVLLQRRYLSNQYIYLVLTVLTLSFSNLQYWFYDTKLNIEYPLLTAVYVQFELLMVPMFYLFVESYIQKPIRIKKLLLVLSPFAVSTLYQYLIHIGVIGPDLKVTMDPFAEYFSMMVNVILIVLIFRSIYVYEKTNKSYSSDVVVVKTLWLKQILIIGLLLIILWVIAFLVGSVNSKEIFLSG